jgi:hypothetical protein
MFRNGPAGLLSAPSITGAPAVAWTIAAVAVPTLIRAAVDGFVSGCELTIYLPFILAVAVLAGWKHATVAALASVLVAELLLMGPNHDFFIGACDAYSVSVLLFGSAALIGVVEAFRSAVAPRSPNGGIVFSRRDGQAWASWYDHPEPLQLGPEDEVAEMMEDFLKQVELGKRLNGHL